MLDTASITNINDVTHTQPVIMGDHSYVTYINHVPAGHLIALSTVYEFQHFVLKATKNSLIVTRVNYDKTVFFVTY